MRAVHVEEDLDTLRRRANREARSRRTLGVAAAVLVVLVAGSLLLLPERGSSAPDSAAPGASTAAPSTGTRFFPGFRADGENYPNVEISYTLPDGWAEFDDMSTLLAPNAVVAFRTVGNVYADGCRWIFLDPPLGPTVDDLANVWGEIPGFTATTPVDITVDGHAGKRVDFTVPDYDETECLNDAFVLHSHDVVRDDSWTGEWARFPEQQNRQWIFDVDGTRLVIHVWSNPGTTPEQLADMDQFLASVQIGSRRGPPR